MIKEMFNKDKSGKLTDFTCSVTLDDATETLRITAITPDLNAEYNSEQDLFRLFDSIACNEYTVYHSTRDTNIGEAATKLLLAANKIAVETRRGAGNTIICSADSKDFITKSINMTNRDIEVIPFKSLQPGLAYMLYKGNKTFDYPLYIADNKIHYHNNSGKFIAKIHIDS